MKPHGGGNYPHIGGSEGHTEVEEYPHGGGSEGHMEVEEHPHGVPPTCRHRHYPASSDCSARIVTAQNGMGKLFKSK
nr:hypothetical protein CFP56_75671 [Quercus suber]